MSILTRQKIIDLFCYFNFCFYLCQHKIKFIMAKVSTATIRLVQKLNRKNKNGEFPIYIVVCYGGRIEKATKISCLPKYWDSKREIIKSGCPNAPVLNKMLNDIKNRLIEARNAFEYEGRVYTPSMLFDAVRKPQNKLTNDFKSLYERLVDERRLSKCSRKRYEYAFRKLVEFGGGDNFIIEELDLGFVKDFSRWLSTKAGVCDGTIKDIMSCIASVWNYAIAKRIVGDDLFPFREFKFCQKFKRGERDYFLDKSHIRLLMDYWLDLVIERNGKRWRYKDGALDRLHKRTSKEWGILWFLLCYKLNGSAPVDVVKLRMDECKSITINGERYWALDYNRKKTKRDVHVRWKRDMFCIIALEHFMGKSKEGYVYPVLDTVDEDKMVKQSGSFGVIALKWVREAFKEINESIIQSNVDNDAHEPLIEVERVDMYTARHSFANHYLNSPNATVSGLASLLSRSPNTIATYVHQLTKDEEIASMVEDMVI